MWMNLLYRRCYTSKPPLQRQAACFGLTFSHVNLLFLSGEGWWRVGIYLTIFFIYQLFFIRRYSITLHHPSPLLQNHWNISTTPTTTICTIHNTQSLMHHKCTLQVFFSAINQQVCKCKPKVSRKAYDGGAKEEYQWFPTGERRLCAGSLPLYFFGGMRYNGDS